MNFPFKLDPQPKTVLCICDQCGDFYQEIDHVAASTGSNPDIPLLCIKCDPWSLKAACVRVTGKGAKTGL